MFACGMVGARFQYGSGADWSEMMLVWLVHRGDWVIGTVRLLLISKNTVPFSSAGMEGRLLSSARILAANRGRASQRVAASSSEVDQGWKWECARMLLLRSGER